MILEGAADRWPLFFFAKEPLLKEITPGASMTNWIIRPANLNDAPEFSRCITAAYAGYAARGVDLPAVADGIDDDIASKLVWVIELNAEIVAGLVAAVVDDVFHIANIAVHPKTQALGLGAALMATAEDEANRKNCTKLRLATHKDMPDNVSFYSRLGWSEVAREGNKVLMEKSITKPDPSD